MFILRWSVLLAILFNLNAFGQRVRVREAPEMIMPSQVDSNSPAFWLNGRFHLFNSTGDGPVLSSGSNQFSLGAAEPSPIFRRDDWPAWIEAVWVDPSGIIFGWYHEERDSTCRNRQLAQPLIGAALSYDNGRTFSDLGVVLSSPVAPDCSSRNGYFSGGHGDVSVMLDREQKYFYFLFGNYGGPLETQGVSIARMAYTDRFRPVNTVWKYYEGSWNQPGVRGLATPILPAKVSWQAENTNSFWGPAIHWNEHLESYVMLLNRSCCTSGWPQQGIYISYNKDLSNPGGWTQPKKILSDTGWYPQVLGIRPGQTDTVAGRVARLYIYGRSQWELVFRRPDEPEPAP